MKKLWLLLLAGGAMTFTPACNNDDEDTGASCPVACTVPATAEIGEEMTIAGQGFAATAEIALRNASGTETKLEDPEITASGFTGTVPATLTPGSYTVILYQDGSWEIGTVTLSTAADKECPVLNIILPEAIRLNEALAIEGIGFSDDMGIVLANTADQARTELEVSLSGSGVSCTIPEGLAAGTYDVILTQGNDEWVIAEAVPAAVYKRLKSFTEKIATQYPGLTVEKLAEALAPYLGYTAEELIASGTAQELMDQMYSDGEASQEYIFSFDTNGNPTGSMTKSQSDETAIPWYTFVVEGNKIMGTNEQFEEGNNNIKNVTLNLNNSRIETVSVSYENRDSEYNWDYDTNGLWLGIDIDLDDSQKFKYDGNNFLGFENNAIFSYDTAAQQNAIFGVDVAKILYAVIIFDFFEEYQLQALCLNLTGKPSLSLPQSFDATGEGEQVSFTYTFDNDGYVTKVSWNKEGQDMYGITQKEQASYEFIYE